MKGISTAVPIFGRVEEQARISAQKLVTAADELRRAGFNIETVSTGSTPACYADVPVPGITEWRPGTYVFNDVQQNAFSRLRVTVP